VNRSVKRVSVFSSLHDDSFSSLIHYEDRVKQLYIQINTCGWDANVRKLIALKPN